MKILYFIDSLQVGGRERRFVELVKYLRAHTDIALEVAVMSKDIGYREYLDLGVPTHFLIRNGKKDPRIFPRLYALCGTVKPDILHAWDSMTATYAAPVARVRRLKFINNMIADALHNLHTFHPSWVRARLTFPLSDFIVGNSQAGLALYRAPAGRSACIYNGFDESRVRRVVDADRVRRNLNIQTPNVVGMVANFSQFKDYDTYLRAAQRILEKRDDVTFLSVGSGPKLETSKAMVQERFREKVRFLGWQADAESIVSALDIGALATFSEGISNSILEYMGFAKPVVATIGGGTSEIVLDGETGYLVGVRDEGQFAEAIERLLNDPIKASAMGQRGRKRVHEVFSMKSMAERYIDVYRRVLDGRIVTSAP
jgi:glycosyltransferase involved in cell wall biosynthesis